MRLKVILALNTIKFVVEIYVFHISWLKVLHHIGRRATGQNVVGHTVSLKYLSCINNAYTYFLADVSILLISFLCYFGALHAKSRILARVWFSQHYLYLNLYLLDGTIARASSDLSLETLPTSIDTLACMEVCLSLFLAHLSGAGHLSLSKMQLVISRQLIWPYVLSLP